jgi:hypothetical protein
MVFPSSRVVGQSLTIGSLPGDAPAGFDSFFTQHVDVLGVHVYATPTTSASKVLHAAAVLAEYIDNDEDGMADDPAVLQALLNRHGSMVMWPTESAFESSGFEDAISDQVFDTTSMQILFGDETNPGYPENDEFDWSLEECLHLVTFGGWALAHPSVFGEEEGTTLADAMDDNIDAGWFHYDDPTCDYPCLISEYTYWALTSLLGGQDYPWRISEITDEWELYSEALVRQHDPAFTALFDDPQWSLPQSLPDGEYVTDGTLFADGFESGGLGSWSASGS